MLTNCSPCTNAVAYTFYLFGGSIPIGLFRLSISIAQIVKHWSEREGTEIIHIDSGNVVLNIKASWRYEAIRGAIELIPIIGAILYIYRDNFNDPNSHAILDFRPWPGILGLNPIFELLKA